MAKLDSTKNLGALSNKVYDLLQGLEPGDRTKVMNSVSQLFGDAIPAPNPGTLQTGGGAPHLPSGSTGPPQSTVANPQQFFAQKDPRNKGEMLAVAARYRELHGGGSLHTIDDFVALFGEARQNFDRHNFSRDIKNAQHQARLFNVGTARGQYRLSHYGQQYVDVLPDREALKKVKRPGSKRKKARGKRAKQAGAK